MQVLEFLNLLPRYYFTLNGAERDVPLSDVQSLTWLGRGQVRLVNRQGRAFTVVSDMQVSGEQMIAFRSRDPVSGQVEQAEIDPLLVKKIVLRWPRQ